MSSDRDNTKRGESSWRSRFRPIAEEASGLDQRSSVTECELEAAARLAIMVCEILQFIAAG
eukprot:5133996-Pyramimonas_sp.AAC.1